MAVRGDISWPFAGKTHDRSRGELIGRLWGVSHGRRHAAARLVVASDTRLRNLLEGFRGWGRIAGKRVVARVSGFSGSRRFAVFLVLSRTKCGQEPTFLVRIVPICHNVEYY